jgi:predicted secreted protein
MRRMQKFKTRALSLLIKWLVLFALVLTWRCQEEDQNNSHALNSRSIASGRHFECERTLCLSRVFRSNPVFFLSTGERIYQMSTSRSQCWCSPLGKIYSLSNINYRVTVFTQQEWKSGVCYFIYLFAIGNASIVSCEAWVCIYFIAIEAFMHGWGALALALVWIRNKSTIKDAFRKAQITNRVELLCW